MEIKLTLNIKSAQEMLRSYGLEKGGRAQQLVDKEILQRLTPYVPYATGALIQSGIQNTHIGSGEIRYSTPYARAVYYGKARSGKTMEFNGAPMRGAFFFERMMADNKKDIAQALASEIGGTAK